MKLENILTKWKSRLLKDSSYSTWHDYIAHNTLDEVLYKFYKIGKQHGYEEARRRREEIPERIKYKPGMIINDYKFVMEYPETKKRLGLFICSYCGKSFIKPVYNIVYHPNFHKC